MVLEKARNTSYRSHLALFKRNVNDGGKQLTSRINVGNAVKSGAEPIIPSEITFKQMLSFTYCKIP